MTGSPVSKGILHDPSAIVCNVIVSTDCLGASRIRQQGLQASRRDAFISHEEDD